MSKWPAWDNFCSESDPISSDELDEEEQDSEHVSDDTLGSEEDSG